MRASLLAALPLAGLAGAASAGPAPVLQTLDYANTRYSDLAQIDAGNVGRLKVAWTFSTGVLRGHEGAPIVVGHVMIVHTPFPNVVYALDLDHDGRILWRYAPGRRPASSPSCAATRSPAGWPTRTGGCSCSRPTPPWLPSTPRPAGCCGR